MQIFKYICAITLGLVSGSFLTGCTATAADAWNDVIKHCAENATFTPKNMIYMGPSNNVGVGAVWRAKQEGGYALIEYAPKDAKSPQGEPIYNVGNEGSCSGQSSHSLKLSASADVVLSAIPGTSGGLSTDLNRAKTADVKAQSWRELKLAEGPFARWLESQPGSAPYRLSLQRPDARLAYRVVEVTGMTATLTFDQDLASEIHAKYAPTAATSSIGELGGKLNIEVKDKNTLVITAPQAFFIEAELAKFYPGVGAGRGASITPEAAKSDSKLTFDVRE